MLYTKLNSPKINTIVNYNNLTIELRDYKQYCMRRRTGYVSQFKSNHKTDLVELLSALHRTSVFNNGENDFKRFVLAFSQIVNFEVKDVYRTVSAIKNRKNENKSLLSRMLVAFQEMIIDAHK
jgi:hypothetical protein